MQKVINFYNEFLSFFPPYVGEFMNFLILVLLIVIYSLLVWKLYRFISRKDPLELELSQYNHSENPVMAKLIGMIIYFFEYLIIIPFIVFLAFSVFTIFLIILTTNQNIGHILIVSAVVIGAIRMTSYYKQNLSQEIAKFLPMTLLAVAVLNPASFSEAQYLEQILTTFSQIPSVIKQIGSYLLFIIILEAVLRIFNLMFSFIGMIEESPEETMPVEEKKK